MTTVINDIFLTNFEESYNHMFDGAVEMESDKNFYLKQRRKIDIFRILGPLEHLN